MSQLPNARSPAPDFDPEALDDELSGEDAHSDSDAASDEPDGDDDGDGVDRAREHYVAVGKSALRKKGALALAPLGKKYEGARVSRDKLYDSDEDEEDGEEAAEEEEGGVGIEDVTEGDIKFGVDSEEEDDDIDSNNALGSDAGEDGRFAGWKFSGSATTKDGVVPQKGDKVVGSDSEDEAEDEESEDENEDGDGDEDEDDEGESESEDESQSGGEDGSEEEDEDEDEDEYEDEDEEEEEKRQALSLMMAEEKTYCSSPNEVFLSG